MVEGSDGALRERRERQLESSQVESKGQRHQQRRGGPVLGLRGARLDAGGGVGRAGIQDQDNEGNRSDNRIRRGPQTARRTIDGGGEVLVEQREGRRRRIRGKLVVCGIRLSKCPSLQVSYCMGGGGTRNER